VTLKVQIGLPAALRGQAAALYWQAFGGKLGFVLGPEPVALRFLERVMRADHVIVAVEDGKLRGMAGFKSPQGSFAGGDLSDLAAVYGRIGGLWRGLLLGLLMHGVDNERFLLDGICVAQEARSRGIGSRLLAAIEAEAVRRGYHAVRLEVIDDNWRARALYERLGFEVLRRERLGPLRLVFGFAASMTMVKVLE